VAIEEEIAMCSDHFLDAMSMFQAAMPEVRSTVANITEIRRALPASFVLDISGSSVETLTLLSPLKLSPWPNPRGRIKKTTVAIILRIATEPIVPSRLKSSRRAIVVNCAELFAAPLLEWL
jgi:hypothetical protein